MAMSLEDLLSEEGFKRSKAKIKPRASFASEGRGTNLYTQRDKRTERTRSDIPRHGSKGEFSTNSSFTKPRDNLIRRGKKDSHRDSWDDKRFSIYSSQDFRGSEITEVVENDEIVEVGVNSSYKDIYSNNVYDHERSWKTEKNRSNVVMDDTKKKTNSSFKQPQSSNNIYESEKIFDEKRSIRQNKLEDAFDTLALDEVAVKAVISILSGYIKRFVSDEDFRTTLHHNSFASMNLIGLDEGLNSESKVIENLEQAIEIVERAAEKNATLKELKKASLQLSVITGLNSSDLRDGSTSGIPNFKLSACAHLYLSAIYVLQNKDKIAAKHILQVFCDSPFQARMILLPDLWDRLFSPHFSHLKLWYDKEARSLSDSPVLTNSKFFEKVYNESLDSGTYRFAMYYNDWIIEGAEAPSIPLIKIPSFSAQLMPRGGLHGHTSSPVSRVSSQPMVSKRLYDEMFRHSRKSGVELEVYEEENFDVSGRGSNSPATEDKQLILYSHDLDTCNNQNDETSCDYLPVVEQRLLLESSSGTSNIDEIYEACQWHQTTSDTANMLQPLTPAKQNELIMERPKSTELKLTEQDAEHQEKCSIPKDFLCPITGVLFEEPVILETGQTFERKAITEWFAKGCITCPITRKILEYQAVPPTNFILKRVINKWKADQFEHLVVLLSEACSNENVEVNDIMTTICMLGQLFAVYSDDERKMNARLIMSFGGLRLLFTRFQCANIEEKTHILLLLSCCVESDAGCRDEIARNMNQQNLLELLHSEQLRTRRNAVLLLSELICLSRRTRAKSFLESLHEEDIINAMDHLLVYLQTCPADEMPIVSVLLLHLDLLSKTQTSNIYRRESIDALTIALERSLSDENVRRKCCKALLILGGFISSSGKLMTEDWILKLAGFLHGPDWDIVENEANDIAFDGTETMVDYRAENVDEENAREMWLLSLSASLLDNGNKSFLDIVSKCLSLGSSDMVRVCLTTVAWLSSSLDSLPDTEFQLRAFASFISPLKQCLEYGELVEHKILASLSLLNFSIIPECKVQLVKIADEIGPSLENLFEVTWTAKELYTIILSKGAK